MFDGFWKKLMFVAALCLIYQIPPVKEKLQPHLEKAYSSFEQSIRSRFGAATMRDFRSGGEPQLLEPTRRAPEPTPAYTPAPKSVSDLNNQDWMGTENRKGISNY